HVSCVITNGWSVTSGSQAAIAVSTGPASSSCSAPMTPCALTPARQPGRRRSSSDWASVSAFATWGVPKNASTRSGAPSPAGWSAAVPPSPALAASSRVEVEDSQRMGRFLVIRTPALAGAAGGSQALQDLAGDDQPLDLARPPADL